MNVVMTEVSESMVCAAVVVAPATERMFRLPNLSRASIQTIHSRTIELLHTLHPPT
jgi:hypothetical protein